MEPRRRTPRAAVPDPPPPLHRHHHPPNYVLLIVYIISMLVAVLLLIQSFIYLAHINQDPSIVAAHIHGDVYFSKKAFQADYTEMEDQFRVYLYDSGDLNKNPFMVGDQKSEMKPSEVYFFDSILRSPFRTLDPDRAHLLFLPFSAPIDPDDKPVEVEGKNITTLSAYERYWNRTLGADHVVLACHDVQVPYDIKELPHLNKNPILITCSSTLRSSSYTPYKDVAFPRVTRPFLWDGANLKKLRERQTIYQILKFIANDVSFLGYMESSSKSFVAEEVLRRWRRGFDFEILSGTLESLDPKEKLRVLQKKFRLCLRGEPVDSACAVESILYGSVPVILSDHYDFPFSDILDWRKFSVVVKESEVQNLERILHKITDSELRLLYENLEKVRRHFQWNTKPVRHDAFNMVMYSLWIRRHVIRYWPTQKRYSAEKKRYYIIG